MLVQSPSRICKSNLSVWKKENSSAFNEISFSEENSKLRKVSEIVLDKNGSYDFEYKENCTILMIVLYGEIVINDFEKPISAEQIFTLKSSESNFLTLKNNLPSEKADVLILELKSKTSENSFSIENLNLNEKNTLIQISKNLECPNFIGLYEGRKEQEYSLYEKGKSIFGMVINGAFELQNRLMETRDAIILNEIEMLEFEALSENALIILFEV
ncbi:hypothetical protein A0O34_05635 [Chryseobacterium glaciei]|uniref:Quercetin 2,3-dioxygenase C-terminal cupin domain-containing protein n=1 Tax=Chryseobacterium glaciei TaxID=1685010 RepID=A0A172XSZ5_9FLAO|nr:hypothetical protein [Chryseobacterium glaciei]ANF50036.1 hypothetical protein A0O34_05635 [Chryseobacterium glaciei]